MRNISTAGMWRLTLGQGELVLMEEASRPGRALDHLDDLLPHRGIVAAENRRAASLEEVGVAAAVYVVEPGALRPVDHQRKGVVEGEVVLDAARYVLLGLGDHGEGLGALLVEALEVGGHRLAGYRASGFPHEKMEAAIDIVDIVVRGNGVSHTSLSRKSVTSERSLDTNNGILCLPCQRKNIRVLHDA